MTKHLEFDVVVVGAGPAGLSAATALRQAGVERVVVVDREKAAGGTPRHCAHSPYGFREYRRPMLGPSYARHLVRTAVGAGIAIMTETTVTELAPGPRVTVSTPGGMATISASRVVLATGARETSRAARFISGARVAGVMSTGALQAMTHLAKRRPFQRPVILGTELVAFSSILTCLTHAIRPVAMVEPRSKITAFPAAACLPAMLGVPIHRNTDIGAILGSSRVEAVVLRSRDGREFRVEADGVIVTGRFVPEATLLGAFLVRDEGTGGPRVDQFGRCSDPCYFAAGNLLRPVETAGWSWDEGRSVAQHVVRSLGNDLPPADRHAIEVRPCEGVKYAVPQRFASPALLPPDQCLQVRIAEHGAGALTLRDQAGRELYRKNITARPERRVLIPVGSTLGKGPGTVHVQFEREQRP